MAVGMKKPNVAILSTSVIVAAASHHARSLPLSCQAHTRLARVRKVRGRVVSASPKLSAWVSGAHGLTVNMGATIAKNKPLGYNDLVLIQACTLCHSQVDNKKPQDDLCKGCHRLNSHNAKRGESQGDTSDSKQRTCTETNMLHCLGVSPQEGGDTM